MKYALVNGQRSIPSPKVRGICPGCGSEVIAKCGQHVIWHWAHGSKKGCDQWWENETEWHRNWKNHFPENWQEIVHIDQLSGEKHISDVKTPSGLVIEFQRSSITDEEVRSRETFYRNMVWVVDGCKNEFDRFNFNMMRSTPDQNGISHLSWHSRSTLFKRWQSYKPVFIDFGEKGFWRLLRFNVTTKKGLVGYVDRTQFVNRIIEGNTDFSEGGGPASSW